MTFPIQVKIREVGPREGVQSYPSIIPLSDRVKLINLLSQCRFEELEIASMVSADKVPQMADSDKLIESILSDPDILNRSRISALYLNSKGFQRCLAHQKLSIEPWISIASSEEFLKHNINKDFNGLENETVKMLNLFQSEGFLEVNIMVSTAFGCSYEGSQSSDKVVMIIKKFADLCFQYSFKIATIMLADTNGMATPKSVKELVQKTKSIFQSSEIGLHLHDTKGLGLVNAYAGLLEGISIFDTSIAGIGGCPFVKGAAGNLATEELAVLCEDLGISTGINLTAIKSASLFAKSIFNKHANSKLAQLWSSISE